MIVTSIRDLGTHKYYLNARAIAADAKAFLLCGYRLAAFDASPALSQLVGLMPMNPGACRRGEPHQYCANEHRTGTWWLRGIAWGMHRLRLARNRA